LANCRPNADQLPAKLIAKVEKNVARSMAAVVHSKSNRFFRKRMNVKFVLLTMFEVTNQTMRIAPTVRLTKRNVVQLV
jgi:hypothetical protein